MSLTPEDEYLLASARAELDPSCADKQRVRSVIAAQLGLAAVVTAGNVSAGAGATTASVSWAITKVIGVLFALAVVGTSAHLMTRPAPKARVSAGPAFEDPKPAEAASTEASLSTQPSSKDAPRGEATVTAPLPSALPAHKSGPLPARADASPASPGEAPLSVETRLVRDTRAARLRGDLDGALSLVRQHATRFPGGVLSEERDAERILVLCAQGRLGEARTFATRFAHDHPQSALGSSVATCSPR